MTDPDRADAPEAGMQPPIPDMTPSKAPKPAAPSWAAAPSIATRLGLLTLSAGGMLAVLGLWAFGHPWLAARVLAGTVLAIVAVLVLL